MAQQRKRARTSSSPAPEESPASSENPLPLETSQEQPKSRKAKFDRRYATATTSAEDVLGMLFPLYELMRSRILSDKQKKTWSSSVYSHFHPPEILIVDDVVKYVFICKKYLFIELGIQSDHEIAANVEIHQRRSREPVTTRVQVTSFDMPITASQKALPLEL
jgi:hypothetical protein